ncbi:uncharacterized protein DUF1905 [Herbihabitans rhizosphaerae]|uniref:Uncharacterized protein DUF1905 n=1 Tax=Herbihabitans rhizosphaerae TaxID=1872711 RepID=A0A4Q7KBY8_9PSEU|nr:YdeI/OmpD-associated family protein [Herbihabitans rhizosphaerae]RZS29684.1 uncharacterized protein DUF1905 [Herbihabitans rhizosphaerae]
MKFHATLELGGKTATGIEVPVDVVETLGSGKRPPVHVTINGHTYRSTVASMGGRYMLPVSAEQRGKAGVAAGDELEVTVELDTEPRTVEIPEDFATALDASPAARAFFDTLSYSHQLRHVLAIEGAKAPETRQRRITKAIDLLRARQK